MHPIQDLFLEGFSNVLQIDMHFICTPMLARFYFFVKSGCYTGGQFLRFLVHERGIETGLKSQEAVRTTVPPTMKRELQQLIGKINFVKRFISNLSRQIEPFMDLVKIKADEEFCWG
jgi:hypothetical protein